MSNEVEWGMDEESTERDYLLKRAPFPSQVKMWHKGIS